MFRVVLLSSSSSPELALAFEAKGLRVQSVAGSPPWDVRLPSEHGAVSALLIPCASLTRATLPGLIDRASAALSSCARLAILLTGPVPVPCLHALTSLQAAFVSSPPPTLLLLGGAPSDAVDALLRISSIAAPATASAVAKHFDASSLASSTTAAAARRLDDAAALGGAASDGLGAALLGTPAIGSLVGLAYHTRRELAALGVPTGVADALGGLFWRA